MLKLFLFLELFLFSLYEEKSVSIGIFFKHLVVLLPFLNFCLIIILIHFYFYFKTIFVFEIWTCFQKAKKKTTGPGQSVYDDQAYFAQPDIARLSRFTVH